MEVIHELKELGLDDSEIKVYLECLAEGGADVKEISKRAGLIRTTVYGVLQSLMKKGLVAKFKKDRAMFFHAVSPQELINIIDQKKARIESILPKLEEIRKKTHNIQRVESFEGKNGVKAITNDILSIPNQTVKIIGAGKKWIDFSSSFATNYYLRKKEARVKTKTILSDTKEERDFMKNKIVKNSEIKFIEGIDVTNSATFIYHDKASFVTYDKENAKGFVIEDKEFNKVQNILFDNLWKLAKK